MTLTATVALPDQRVVMVKSSGMCVWVGAPLLVVTET